MSEQMAPTPDRQEELISQEQMEKLQRFDAEMQSVSNLLMNTKQIAVIQKIATQYSRSNMVPANYQKNPDNCFVACELAARMNVSPILVMQNLYIVQGKPSWAGSACKALVDGCGKFKHSEFIFFGEQGKPDWGCCLQAISAHSGLPVRGSRVTWQMATDEGWVNKSGSKWKTMPEQMMKYRAAAFFARTECPEVLMGYQTADEVDDIVKPEPETVKLSLGSKEKTEIR